MTTHGEFLRKAIKDAGWECFETVQSYTEFVQKERDAEDESQIKGSSRAAELVDAIKRDYRQAPLTSKDRAMLDLTRKLAIARRELGPSDYASLRTEGFT